MRSITLYTEEIDDAEEAVEELVEQLSGFELAKNSVAIVFIEEELEYDEFYAELRKKSDIPVIGCTAMAMLLGEEGYCGGGISVMILTDDECEFSAEIVENLTKDNYEERITDAYKAASSRLPEKEKLIISYGVLVKGEKDVYGDGLVATLDKASGGTPIFGGLASEAFNFTGSMVFYNEKIIENGQVMLLISGNIKPKYLTINSIDNKSRFSFEITKSKGNEIQKLGKETFVEALRNQDFIVDKEEVMGDYLLSPFVVTIEQPNGEKVEAARTLSFFNLEKETGTFLGATPEGSYLSIGIISRDAVQSSLERGFDLIKGMLEGEEGYNTLLCTTCVGRFLALASDVRVEAKICTDKKPDGFSLMGMYSYGEFCPIKGERSGKDYNMFHNFTFVILAF
ncbi:MAG: FIST C-terminal domain-containing protein [Eubacterium sp.]|nr:FIST C-terminal domain-containing protein [Eubacterium sp.]